MAPDMVATVRPESTNESMFSRPSGLPSGTMSAVVYWNSGSEKAATAQRSGRIDMPALTASNWREFRPGMSEFQSVSLPSTSSMPSEPKISRCMATVAPMSSPPSSKLYGASPAKPTTILPASCSWQSRSLPPSSPPSPPRLVRLQAARDPPRAAAESAREAPRKNERRLCMGSLSLSDRCPTGLRGTTEDPVVGQYDLRISDSELPYRALPRDPHPRALSLQGRDPP